MLAHVFCLLLVTPAASGTEPSVDVRVGVVAFGGHTETAFDRAEELFKDIHQQDKSFRFRLAAGTHAHVLHWLQRGMIDVAVMTPGVYVQTLNAEGEEGICELLANKRLPPEKGAWAQEDRGKPGYHDLCYSICIVPENSPFKNINDILEAAMAGNVKFLFVHPLSVSARIVPQTALREAGITLSREQILYTYSQTESLRLIEKQKEQGAKENLVAFVWDGAIQVRRKLGDKGRLKLPKSLHAISFQGLADLEVPTNVIVARFDFEHRDKLGMLLLDHKDSDFKKDLTQPETSSRRLAQLHEWSKELGLRSFSGNRQMVSLEEIGHTLLHYAQSQPSPPRLALVLSGGGAKCAYQVGAVEALEKELDSMRKSHPRFNIDIGLVVGTSGGAINAVPIALGITADLEGREHFRRTWRQLDQREIVRPSLLVRGILGVWFALLQALFLLALVKLTLRSRDRGWVFSLALIALASFEIVLGYVGWSPWRWLGHQHAWHHLWLVCTFGIRAAAWSLLAVGILTLIAQRYLVLRKRFLAAPAWLVRWIIIAGVIGLPTLLGTVVLFWEETLSNGEGLEQVLAEKFPPLIEQYLTSHRPEKNKELDKEELKQIKEELKKKIIELEMEKEKPEFDKKKLEKLNNEIEKLETLIKFAPLYLHLGSDPRSRLKEMSRQLLDPNRKLFRRDLVLTGSCLKQSNEQHLPGDLYFYFDADPTQGAPPSYGDKGISFADYRDLLFDVVIGSSSIFPAFPPRTVYDFPASGDRVELIDGGFAHGSPIEAAVLWGATHIVLIEATPQVRVDSRNFLENSVSAFDYLYEQAQMIDSRSRGRVIIFSLSPEPPHLCILDFADNLISAAIDKGYQEAIGPRARFRKDLGEPIFTQVTDTDGMRD